MIRADQKCVNAVEKALSNVAGECCQVRPSVFTLDRALVHVGARPSPSQAVSAFSKLTPGIDRYDIELDNKRVTITGKSESGNMAD